MSQTLNASPRALREAFYALSTAQEIPDARLLDDLVRQHPQYGAELTEFAIALAVDALRGDHAVEAAEAAIDPTIVSPAVSRAMSHFQNRLHAVTIGGQKAVSEPATVPPNPFSGLSRGEFRGLATRLNANAVFVSKLRDRQIDPDTIRPGFRTRVADELKAPLDVVVAHFAARQPMPTGQFFKADGKPTTGAQQSFDEAVKNSGLTPEQQAYLLGL